MEYRGFKVIQEFKEPRHGAWRAYMIDDPEVVCDGATCTEVLEKIVSIEIDRLHKEALKYSIKYESMKRHFSLMMGAMDEYMSREELRDADTCQEYLEAAKFAQTLGIKVRVKDVEQWIENELNKK